MVIGFFEGLSAVSRWAQPALMAMGGPIGLPGVALSSALDTWAQNKLKERNPQKKNKQRNPGMGPGNTFVAPGKSPYQNAQGGQRKKKKPVQNQQKRQDFARDLQLVRGAQGRKQRNAAAARALQDLAGL